MTFKSTLRLGKARSNCSPARRTPRRQDWSGWDGLRMSRCFVPAAFIQELCWHQPWRCFACWFGPWQRSWWYEELPDYERPAL